MSSTPKSALVVVQTGQLPQTGSEGLYCDHRR